MRPSLTILTAAAFASGVALSACASTDSAPPPASASASSGRSCFYRSEVDGFRHVRNKRPGSSDAVIVSVGPRRQYLFETLGPCHDIDWSETIGFDQVGPGEICSGLDVDLIVPSTIGPQRCAVKMIRPITPEEAKAY